MPCAGADRPASRVNCHSPQRFRVPTINYMCPQVSYYISKMTYACPAWESAADSHLMKLQRLQN